MMDGKNNLLIHFNRLIVVAVIGFVLGGLSAKAHAQDPVPVSLPDMAGLEIGATVEIPVTIDEPLTSEQASIQSYQLTIEYNPAVVDITGAITEGTLTDGWTTSENTDESNTVSVTGTTTSTQQLEEGTAGELIILEVEVLEEGSSPLAFIDFLFNEGTPSSQVADGSVTIEREEKTSTAVINEVLYDPPSGLIGDANGDGTHDPDDDEFIEIAVVPSASESLDLSGWALSDEKGVVHTFPDGTVLEPGLRLTIFGGGSPTGIPGLTQTATSGALNLNNDSDTITLTKSSGTTVTQIIWSPSAPATASTSQPSQLPALNASAPMVSDESIARSPEFTGNLVPHTEINGQPFSPGERNDEGGAPPVEFSGAPTPVVEGRNVILTWTTLLEIENAGFYVQQQQAKGEGKWSAWTTVNPDARIEGAGTYEGRTDYHHVVRDLEPGRYRFRIQQEDVDGDRSVSAASASVEVSLAEGFTLQSPYPNPLVSGRATLAFSAGENQSVKAALYNSLGQRVRVLDVRQGARAGEIRVEVQGLASGLYFVRLTTSGVERKAVRSLTVVR